MMPLAALAKIISLLCAPSASSCLIDREARAHRRPRGLLLLLMWRCGAALDRGAQDRGCRCGGVLPGCLPGCFSTAALHREIHRLTNPTPPKPIGQSGFMQLIESNRCRSWRAGGHNPSSQHHQRAPWRRRLHLPPLRTSPQRSRAVALASNIGNCGQLAVIDDEPKS